MKKKERNSVPYIVCIVRKPNDGLSLNALNDLRKVDGSRPPWGGRACDTFAYKSEESKAKVLELILVELQN